MSQVPPGLLASPLLSRSRVGYIVFLFLPCVGRMCSGASRVIQWVHGQAFDMLAVIRAMFGYLRLVQESVYYMKLERSCLMIDYYDVCSTQEPLNNETTIDIC